MSAADPPPPPEGDPAGVSGDSGSGRVRRRIRIGRFLTKARLPAVEFVRSPKPESAETIVAPRPEVGAIPFPAFDGTLAVAVLVLAAFLASFAAVNADLWLNLAAGRLVAHGQFSFGPDPFSAAHEATWVNHAWLFDLLMYLLYRPGGVALVAAKAGLIVAVAAVLLTFRRRSDSGGLGPVAATTVVLLAGSPMFLLRPDVASYLLFSALLLILHRRIQWAPRDSRGAKWQLPLAVGCLFALWVNLDGGFVFGLMLLGVWTAGAVLQWLMPLGDDGDDPGEAPHPPSMLAIACAAALVGCLLNPYHVHVFHLPPELSARAIPEVVRADPFVERTLRDVFLPKPISMAYMEQAGTVPAVALYLLMGIGLASFVLNIAGWRWRRVLAWTAFVCLCSTFGRTVPYFALIGGPAIVLNLQACLARQRSASAENANQHAVHVRTLLAAAARTGVLVAITGLLILAWPGWLGADARLLTPPRRVAWRVVPDPTLERLATRLDGWYKSGELHEGEARGFHLQPEFSEYCAWFCPAEKGVFDSRLTAPPDVLIDYLAARRSLVALTNPAGPEHPGPPDAMLRKLGTTHLVLNGGEVLNVSPFVTGLGLVMFTDPDRFPAWAIAGRGVICGWGDRHPKLRLDPIQLAVGDAVEPLPPPVDVPPPAVLTAGDRYRAALPPPPPETAEAGLWLAYRDATAHRGGRVAIPASQVGAEVMRLAPTAPSLRFSLLFDTSKTVQDAWRQSPDGRAGRATSLLAIRAARKAMRANPDHPEAYIRLTQAYSNFDTDPAVGQLQLLAAARQALARLNAVAAFRRTAPREEYLLQELLYNHYKEALIPGSQTPPMDLVQEALARMVEILPIAIPLPAGADPANPEYRMIEEQQRRLRNILERLSEEINKRRDNFEIGYGNAPPAKRADAACRRYGLVREALKALREADGKDLDVPTVVLLANLFLLAGEAENARDVLQSPALNPVDQFPIEYQMPIHILTMYSAAALGDYSSAVEHCQAVIDLVQRPAAAMATKVVANLVLPDSGPAGALTRVGTLPAWAGLWPQGRPGAVKNVPLFGDLFPVVQTVRQHTEELTREGLLSLEAGDIPTARQKLNEAAKSPLASDSRTLAQHWLELWH